MLQKKLILGSSAGTFYMLPWITRSLEKLYRLIDQEMYSIGAQKLTMPCLASKNLWMSTGNILSCLLWFFYDEFVNSYVHLFSFVFFDKNTRMYKMNWILWRNGVGLNQVHYTPVRWYRAKWIYCARWIAKSIFRSYSIV